MPAAKPPEFRRRALELAASGGPVAQAPRNLEISKPSLRPWVTQPDVNRGRAEGLTSAVYMARLGWSLLRGPPASGRTRPARCGRLHPSGATFKPADASAEAELRRVLTRDDPADHRARHRARVESTGARRRSGGAHGQLVGSPDPQGRGGVPAAAVAEFDSDQRGHVGAPRKADHLANGAGAVLSMSLRTVGACHRGAPPTRP